jgi:hypothetical protein
VPNQLRLREFDGLFAFPPAQIRMHHIAWIGRLYNKIVERFGAMRGSIDICARLSI